MLFCHISIVMFFSYPAEKYPEPDDCRADVDSGVCEYLPVSEKFAGVFLYYAFYPVLCLHRRSYRSDRQHLLPKETGERADGLKPDSTAAFYGRSLFFIQLFLYFENARCSFLGCF